MFHVKVSIIKYNAGNIYSVYNALKRIGVEADISSDKEDLARADKLIFPGVGEARSTMAFLRETGLDVFIKNISKPFLGICLGMQLMCRYSEEGDTDCLGIFDVNVLKFRFDRREAKIPHMGWNNIHDLKTGLFDKDLENAFVYFVHSYYVPQNIYSIASTDYVHPFCSALHKDNFYATQFHPEKSGGIGEKILRNFLNL